MRYRPAEGHNQVSGTARHVVQAARVTGGVHIHPDAESTFPPPQQLPAQPAHFTGRESELAKLDLLLHAEAYDPVSTVVVTAIAGTAGIGKTSLALRWAHQERSRFPDGQLYINLRGYDPNPPLTAAQALDTFLRALGMPPERIPADIDAMAALCRTLLAGRRMLVLLDNAAVSEQVRPLVPNTSGCAVLVTSRSALHGLVARDGAHRVILDMLSPSEAELLLGEVIGHDRVGREPAIVTQLARQCAYLPLALRVAAERVVAHPTLMIADLVNELAVEHGRLDALAPLDDEGTAIRTVFSCSYRRLPPETARVFRLLGLHPGTDISLAAATALVGTTLGETRQQLDRLVSVHLIAEAEGGRYQFHDLLRDYAAERVRDDEPADSRVDANHRLYQWYLHAAHAAMFAFYPQHPVIPVGRPPTDCRPLAFHNREHARDWFASEHGNLLAIIRRAPAVGQYTVAWQLPIAFDSYLIEDHHVADQVTVHTLGLAAAESQGHQIGQRWAYGLLGEAHYQARRHEDAIHYQLRALEIAQNTQDAFGKAASLGDLARSCIELERCAEAVRYSEEALQINRAIGNKRNEGIVLVHLGNALGRTGDQGQAMLYLNQGMNILRDIGSTGSEALALRSISRILHERGDDEEACNYLQNAINLYCELHVDHWYGETLTEYGDLLIGMGQVNKARDVWLAALSALIDLNPDDARQVQKRLDSLSAA